MPRLQELQEFAESQGFDITHPLNHADVVALASYWLPQIFFHPAERFHPIGIGDIFAMIGANLEASSPEAQDARRVGKMVRTGPLSGAVERFLPPVLTVPDGLVEVNPALPNSGHVRVHRVLGSGSEALPALDL